jgi:hypothetical protein
VSDKPRIETGALMIDDDWPGVFIRGKHAFQYEATLHHAIILLENTDKFGLTNPLLISVLKGLLSDLRSCRLPMKDQSKLQKVWRGESPATDPHERGPSDEIAEQPIFDMAEWREKTRDLK